MPKKPKRKLTAAERAARRRRKAETRIVFINGKQKRMRREPTIDGLPIEEFIRRNADPAWLMANGYYEYLNLPASNTTSDSSPDNSAEATRESADDRRLSYEQDVPF